MLQTTVFGVSESAPSIRPLQVHGLARWMGQPGQPEPGLLSTLVHLVIALLVWWLLWRGRTQQRPS